MTQDPGAGAPFPQLWVEGAGGVPLATYHLGGEGPPVLAVHATGFHGRCWAPMAPALAPRYSVWSFDLRGHGSSGHSPDGTYDDWTVLAEDLLAVADALGLAGVRGIGHSCGGAALLLAEQSRPGTFASLFLYEPIVFSPDQVSAMGDNRLSNLARRRRNHFESRAAARANYASKPPFERFDPSSLDAYVRYGLVDRADGTVSLACSPDEEASMYEGATRHKAYDHLAEVGVPVRLAGGAAGGDISPEMLETLASRLPDGDVAMEDGLTHFGPMEAPLELGRTIADWLDSVGARSTNVVPPPR